MIDFVKNTKLHFIFRSDDDSDGEIADIDLSKILIVTQTPPAFRKHPQGDRTGDHTSRAKMTSEMAKVIDEGLYYYEQDLWENPVCFLNNTRIFKFGSKKC